MTDAERIELAIQLALDEVDGEHHKTWVIDQMLRVLAGDRYELLTANRDWDKGTAP